MNTSDDPGLPIKLGPCSNGEYDPVPLLPAVRAARRLANDESAINARRLGMTRREFLLSTCGAAVTLLAIDTVARSVAAPGGRYLIPPEARWDPAAADARLGGDEFILDVQGHLLEYVLDPATRGARFFGPVFPQVNCGEDDPRACFSMTHFVEEVFLRSDTSMVVLSALPILPEGSPLPLELMEETRRVALGLSRDDRILVHAQALPHIGEPAAVLDALAETVDEHRIEGWKTFTHFPDPETGLAWFLDDHDPTLPQVGRPFIERSLKLGVRVICVHKGLSGNSTYSSPVDIGRVANDYPEMSFVVYHSGYETSIAEGPYTEATRHLGVNRLIASLEDNGIGPNQNVYAEIGSTWWHLMGRPTEAAHLLGKLLRYVGELNLLWGTDSIWYGSPQDQIQALRAFEIAEDVRERYGYPMLTDRVKRNVFGYNAARLYRVDPVTVPFTFTRDELAQLRLTLPYDNETFGPTSSAEMRRFEEIHQGLP